MHVSGGRGSYQRLRTQQGGLEGFPDKIAIENYPIKEVWPTAASLGGRQKNHLSQANRKG